MRKTAFAILAILTLFQHFFYQTPRHKTMTKAMYTQKQKPLTLVMGSSGSAPLG